MAVRVVDRGANQVLREIGGRRAPGVIDVGVLGSKAGAAKRGQRAITVADVAEWAEFGIGQPQRSWLRGWIDAHEDLIQRQIAAEMQAVISARRTRSQAIKRLGVWIQGEIQLNIANHPANGFPPNAPSTIARKGSSTPLIDTGQLRASISHRIVQG